MIRLNNVRLVYTSLRPPPTQPRIRWEVAQAMTSHANGLLFFAPVRLMRTSTKWSLLP